jgi:hypothetical protein
VEKHIRGRERLALQNRQQRVAANDVFLPTRLLVSSNETRTRSTRLTQGGLAVALQQCPIPALIVKDARCGAALALAQLDAADDGAAAAGNDSDDDGGEHRLRHTPAPTHAREACGRNHRRRCPLEPPLSYLSY